MIFIHGCKFTAYSKLLIQTRRMLNVGNKDNEKNATMIIAISRFWIQSLIASYNGQRYSIPVNSGEDMEMSHHLN